MSTYLFEFTSMQDVLILSITADILEDCCLSSLLAGNLSNMLAVGFGVSTSIMDVVGDAKDTGDGAIDVVSSFPPDRSRPHNGQLSSTPRNASSLSVPLQYSHAGSELGDREPPRCFLGTAS
jgi:hypothetical protein